MAKRAGFTLVELMTVASILVVLMTMSMPMIRSLKAVSGGYGATRGLQQLYAATTLYMADSDDVYMIASSPSDDGITAWFGHKTGKDGPVDLDRGILAYYLGKQRTKDPIHEAVPMMGDGSGFGYNWGVLGSDMHLSKRYDEYPHCLSPASSSLVADPSKTALFATSAHFDAPWDGGTGFTYDYGFIDPPSDWKGVPTVDFRHHGERVVDAERKTAVGSGQALFLFCDGSVRPLKSSDVSEEMFQRLAGYEADGHGFGVTE